MTAETYHGRPCRACGGTLRYRSNRDCVPCLIAANRRYRRQQGARPYEESHRVELTRPGVLCICGVVLPEGEWYCSPACKQTDMATVLAPLDARIQARLRPPRLPIQTQEVVR